LDGAQVRCGAAMFPVKGFFKKTCNPEMVGQDGARGDSTKRREGGGRCVELEGTKKLGDPSKFGRSQERD